MPNGEDVDASFGPSAVLRTVWTRPGQALRTCPPLAHTRRSRAHILTASATTIHENGDGTDSNRFPDCSVIPGNPSTEQTGEFLWGFHETKRETTIEDIDFRAPRGLDKDLVLSLADGRWVREHLSILIIGPAGIGKSWIACALAHSACRHGHSASYRRLPRLLTELAIARADGSYPKLLASLAKTEVLVIDDFGLAKLSAENRRDLLEITEDRYGIRSTVITSQLPVENWHDIVGDPTLADAILDRLVHSSYQLNLKGKSMRKRRQPLTQTDHRDS